MNPVQTRRNQYRGINAHLHSQLQRDGGWDSLHAVHLAHLTVALQEQLQPLGYEADIQQSVQIRPLGGPSRSPESDVTIFDTDPGRAAQPPLPGTPGIQEIVLSIPTLLDIAIETAEMYKAVAVYERGKSPADREPVVWIELLSPSNKPPGRDFQTYRHKREALLQTGLVFVELDYLHHSPPTVSGVIDYTARPDHADARPFRIIVIDPRPAFLDGAGVVHQFAVDEPIPTVTLPLNAGDRLDFAFDAPYQRTFREMFYGNRVDYAALPPAFDRYSPADRTRIVNRLLGVLTTPAADRETATIAPTAYTLAEGLARLSSP